MTTLRDVAQKAHISYSAVSQILNNSSRRNKFAPATIERVLACAQELGYTTNQFAKSLKTGRTMLVGITGSTNVQTGDTFFQPYFSKVFSGINEVIGRDGYRLVLQNTSGNLPLDAAREIGQSQITDGLIYILAPNDISEFNETHLPMLKALKQPFVVIHSQDKMEGCNNVGVDAITGSMRVVDHLTDQGYRRIGFVNRTGGHRLYDNLLQGFTQAHTYMDIPFSTKLNLFMVGNDGAEHGYRLVNRLLAQKTKLPEAFFVVNDWIAQGMMLRFRHAGIRVPEDISIIGYGDFIDQSYNYTGLTTLSGMATEKGWKGGSMLLQSIKNNAHTTSKIIDPQIIVRDSCGCRK